MKSNKIALGADHAGFTCKETIKEYLKETGNTLVDVGTYSEQSVDYPDFAHQVATRVSDKSVDIGILFCGSGNGVAIAANKHKNIRAALCWTPEIARLARMHNNANILCIPARFVDADTAIAITAAFLETEFEGGRHERRVEKIEIV
ncbi:MAG TPA: ribose 5-phosphate isomerase B [Bacteroidia bacterium]|nr:ribose 5-phosphate isomerase B [Bacteroidia bacterium]